PMTAWISPGRSASDTSATAARPPKWRLKARTRRAGSGTIGLERGRPLHEPGDALGQGEDRDDDEEPHRQEPVLARDAEIILEQHQREGAEDRPVQGPHAA